VGVVTSLEGAALQDILRVLRRRFPNLDVWIYAARVQGDEAAREIAEGIRYFNRHRLVDVLIAGRGGGSLEDLWPFNEEEVARAIAASAIPVISAVGHETDFTIADFVADVRAPTPSAAAEMVVRPKQDFIAEIQSRVRHLTQLARLRLAEARSSLTSLALSRSFQELLGEIRERAQRVDEAASVLDLALRRRLFESRQAWAASSAGIVRFDFPRLLHVKRGALQQRSTGLSSAFANLLAARRQRLLQLEALTVERSPLTILGRGYSITRNAEGSILRDAGEARLGEAIAVRLARGELGALVREKKT
jgi:exodeoxyribonuclease VII large subunit